MFLYPMANLNFIASTFAKQSRMSLVFAPQLESIIFDSASAVNQRDDALTLDDLLTSLFALT